jgi:hypothetical protein
VLSVNDSFEIGVKFVNAFVPADIEYKDGLFETAVYGILKETDPTLVETLFSIVIVGIKLTDLVTSKVVEAAPP